MMVTLFSSVAYQNKKEKTYNEQETIDSKIKNILSSFM